MTKPDLRHFLFMGRADSTDPGASLDLIDNLNAELERLSAMTELLGVADGEEFQGESLTGVSMLLGDIHRRMKTVLDLFYQATCHPKPRKRVRKPRA